MDVAGRRSRESTFPPRLQLVPTLGRSTKIYLTDILASHSSFGVRLHLL